MKLKDRALRLIGLEPMTNREMILGELAKMRGYELISRTGLSFNGAVLQDVTDRGMTWEEWLDAPAAMNRIFPRGQEGAHGAIQHHGRCRGAEAVL